MDKRDSWIMPVWIFLLASKELILWQTDSAICTKPLEGLARDPLTRRVASLPPQPTKKEETLRKSKNRSRRLARRRYPKKSLSRRPNLRHIAA